LACALTAVATHYALHGNLSEPSRGSPGVGIESLVPVWLNRGNGIAAKGSVEMDRIARQLADATLPERWL
jgi:hypothetical protein